MNKKENKGISFESIFSQHLFKQAVQIHGFGAIRILACEKLMSIKIFRITPCGILFFLVAKHAMRYATSTW